MLQHIVQPWPTIQAQHDFSRLCIPETRHVGGRRDQQAIGAEHRAVARRVALLSTASSLPVRAFDMRVVSSSERVTTRSPSRLKMTLDTGASCLRRTARGTPVSSVPDHGGAVRGAGHDQAAIAAERGGPDAIVMSLQDHDRRVGLRLDVPQPRTIVRRRGQNPRSIGTEYRGPHMAACVPAEPLSVRRYARPKRERCRR